MVFRLLCILFILLRCLPAQALPYFVIHLENEGHFITSYYWEEGNEIRFNVPGGSMGVQKGTVKRIRRVDDRESPSVAAGSAVAEEGLKINPELLLEKGSREGGRPEQKPATAPDKGLEKPELDSLKERKQILTIKLNEALERLRQATRNQDVAEKEKVRGEMREISKEIYALTDDVRKRNNGILPKGWWSN
jgi:hypothetical protein